MMMVPASDPRPLHSALIVDDHPLFCDALSMTLKSVAGIEEIETADRLETAIHRVDLNPAPDAIVLDLNLPDVNGIDGLNPNQTGPAPGFSCHCTSSFAALATRRAVARR